MKKRVSLFTQKVRSGNFTIIKNKAGLYLFPPLSNKSQTGALIDAETGSCKEEYLGSPLAKENDFDEYLRGKYFSIVLSTEGLNSDKTLSISFDFFKIILPKKVNEKHNKKKAVRLP